MINIIGSDSLTILFGHYLFVDRFYGYTILEEFFKNKLGKNFRFSSFNMNDTYGNGRCRFSFSFNSFLRSPFKTGLKF